MPAYNAARWIGEAIDSVLAQTYGELELVVSDNASTDDTAAIVRSYDDPRIRLEISSELIPPVDNHNRSVSLSRGSFVKFLHADDLLMPTCLEEMLTVALEDGLVFAPREVLLDDAEDEESVAWRREHERLSDQFAELAERNDGRALFREILASGIDSNWVGEPSAVMTSRACLDKVGLFNVHVRQIADIDLWLRIMLWYDVGYIPHPLSSYRHHAQSVTATNARLGRDWPRMGAGAAGRGILADERRAGVGCPPAQGGAPTGGSHPGSPPRRQTVVVGRGPSDVRRLPDARHGHAPPVPARPAAGTSGASAASVKGPQARSRSDTTSSAWGHAIPNRGSS
jgi:hypothetical protein